MAMYSLFSEGGLGENLLDVADHGVMRMDFHGISILSRAMYNSLRVGG